MDWSHLDGNANTFTCHRESDLRQVVAYVYDTFRNEKVIALHGDLGAGKTALVRAWLQYAGSKDTVTSPTYAIINEYAVDDQQVVYHMDLYRLEDIAEAWEIGIEEYLHSGSLCLIEWPDIILPLFTMSHVIIYIAELPDESRRVMVSKSD